MSIDTGFDPTRPEADAQPSTSLTEEPVPHLDEPIEEGAPVEEHAQPVEGARDTFSSGPTGEEREPRGEGALGLLQEVAERALDFDDRLRDAVEKHPMRSLGIAVLAGFLIGRVASRI